MTAPLVTAGTRIGPRALLLTITSLLLAAAPLSAAPSGRGSDTKQTALTVFSIVPSQAEPGGQVTLALSRLQNKLTVTLGGDEVPWQAVDERRISFVVDPKAQPGQYTLSVQAAGGPAKSYVFTVLPLKPVAVSIEPDRITSCVGDTAREVTVSGRNFSAESQLLFDGAIIRSRVQPPDAIRFTAPVTRGGLHQVAVKNGELASTPLGLAVITAPEISAVTIGTDHVSSYELLIDGDNFQQTSSLLVDGTRISTAGTLAGERLVFVDCTRLIYQRRPYSSTPKELRLQVVNPDGEVSQSVLVSAP